MHGQTFKSTATAHTIESYEIEFMERTVEISDDEIIIISQGKKYKDIQTLNVVEIEEKEYGKLGVLVHGTIVTPRIFLGRKN